MRMTPEHKVLRASRRRHSYHSRKKNVHWWTLSEPEWVESKRLKPGDLVLFPRMKEESDSDSIVLQPLGPLSNQTGIVGRHWSRLKATELFLSKQTLELMGLYIAEGYAESTGQVMLAINTNENDLTSMMLGLVREAWIAASYSRL